MEGIQKNVDSLQQQMTDLQLQTGIETSIIVKTNQKETDYFFTVLVNINEKFEPAVENVDFEGATCYLYGLSIGYELSVADNFRKISNN